MKYIFLFVLAFIAVGGIYYFFRVPTTPPTQQVVIQPTLTNSPTVAIPTGWKTYASQKYGFTISYPSDVIHDTNTEGERFYKHGPTQSTGTELYDGMIILIKSGSLNGMSLQDFVKKQFDENKNNPVQPTMTEIRPITVAGLRGWVFGVSAIGERRAIYLPKGETDYIEIDDMTVEPANRKSLFATLVSTMLASLRL